MAPTRKPAAATQSDADLNLDAFDDLNEELRRLAATQQELLGPASANSSDGADELTLLRHENAELRSRLEELEQYLQSAGPTGDSGWEDRQREYESLLEEKSEVIRGLHMKLQEVQELQELQLSQPLRAAIDPADVPDAEELIRQKRELEEQRRQIEEDEESLMAQMRQMELALSRDRAELARQRNELQRLRAELNHEIEQASRDTGLRERLKNLRPAESKKETPTSDDTPTTPMPKSSGLLRRLFG